MTKTFAAVCLIAAWLAIDARAAPAPSIGPSAVRPSVVRIGAPESTNCTVITSERLTFDYKRSIADFEGKVVAVDPRLRLESDRLILTFDAQNNVKAATAVGNVRLADHNKVATCKKAIYLIRSGEIILSGNARVTRGRDTVTGSEITLWPDDEKIEVSRGRLVIHPEEGKKSPVRLPGRRRSAAPRAPSKTPAKP
jgi:lipopolysaccharide export system protein LptA